MVVQESAEGMIYNLSLYFGVFGFMLIIIETIPLLVIEATECTMNDESGVLTITSARMDRIKVMASLRMLMRHIVVEHMDFGEA